MIRSWSHSTLVNFERCKFYAYLRHDQRIPEPERPLPPGKTEHANDRGTRVHTGCELFVQGKGPMPNEAKTFADDLEQLKKLYKRGQVSVEGEWGMNEAWEPTDWATAWFRCKIDVFVHLSDTHAAVIDYKTGKKFGNELKHHDQLVLYTITAFLRHPELEKVTTELWYFDADDITQKTFTRDQGLRFLKHMNKRGTAITTCTEFPPASNKEACRYCQYGEWNGGQCQNGRR